MAKLKIVLLFAILVLEPKPTFQLGPNIVRVKELECLHRLKIVHMLVRHLCNFKQSQLILVLNKSTTLNVSPCFIGHLHDELVFVHFATQQIVQDVQIHGCAKVIDVGQETVFTAFVDELLKKSRILE